MRCTDMPLYPTCDPRASNPTSESEVYDQFNTNVFGIARMVRAVLPYLRAQKSGVVANVGSMAGWRASPAGGWYCATKFAIAGLSEALRFEVAHLGIDVVSVDLGSFRTSLLGGNMVIAKKHIAELDPATEPTKQLLASRNGLQRGDPAKAAKVVVDALTKSGACEGRAIPSRLVVGSDAVRVVGAALQKGREELESWAELVSATDFDDVAP